MKQARAANIPDMKFSKIIPSGSWIIKLDGIQTCGCILFCILVDT
jgi:hypothetical protein